MGIEFLNCDNIEELIDIFHMGHASSSWGDYPFDRELLKKNLYRMIGDDNYFACMYRKNDTIIGGWMASVGQLLFSKKLIGMENGIYIDPSHRGGRIALLMYNEFIKWCEKMGAEPLVEIYFSGDAENEKTYSFFNKIGMVECGKIFRGVK